MNLNAIVDLLEAASLGDPGSTLFWGKMPLECQSGLLVTTQTPISIHSYVSELRRGTFQVIARHKTFDGASTLADSVIDAMPSGGVIGDMKFLTLRPSQEPLLYPRSDGDFVEASVNFNFSYIAI